MYETRKKDGFAFRLHLEGDPYLDAALQSCSQARARLMMRARSK